MSARPSAFGRCGPRLAMHRPSPFARRAPEASPAPALAALSRLARLATTALRARSGIALSREAGQPAISQGSTCAEAVVDSDAVQALLALGRRVVVRDTQQLSEGDERRIAQALGARALVGVPFSEPSRGRSGMVVVCDSVPRDWDPIDVGLIEELAHGALIRWALLEEIEERERREEELRLIQSLTEAIFAAPDVETAVRIALQKVCEFTGWEYGEAWLPDERNERLVPARAWFAAKDDRFSRASLAFSFARGEGIPGRVWERQPRSGSEISRRRWPTGAPSWLQRQASSRAWGSLSSSRAWWSPCSCSTPRRSARRTIVSPT